MPFHPPYAKDPPRLHYQDPIVPPRRHYVEPTSSVFTEHIYQDTVPAYALGHRIHDLAMWYRDEPVGQYRQIYNNKETFQSAVRRVGVVEKKHDVYVQEAEVVYRPSKELMGELEMLDGLFRVQLRDKYFDAYGGHFDPLQEYGDYDRLEYNMDVHRREGNGTHVVSALGVTIHTPYTETLWFELRALKLYWDSLITKRESVDVPHLLKFTSKTLVDVQEAIHTQHFHSTQTGSKQISGNDLAVLYEYERIIKTIEKGGERMQKLGEIWSSGTAGVSFKLKELYRAICGLAYEPRKSWLAKEGQEYMPYIDSVGFIYNATAAYERNPTQPFAESGDLQEKVQQLNRSLQVHYMLDVHDFVDVYELWKLRMGVPPQYVAPAVPLALGWQPEWATGTHTRMRALLEEL